MCVPGGTALWSSSFAPGGRTGDQHDIAILGGFVYLAAIMDAWSRRIVGYALGRRIDARLTLTTAIEGRNPPPGCIHHSDSEYAGAGSLGMT